MPESKYWLSLTRMAVMFRKLLFMSKFIHSAHLVHLVFLTHKRKWFYFGILYLFLLGLYWLAVLNYASYFSCLFNSCMLCKISPSRLFVCQGCLQTIFHMICIISSHRRQRNLMCGGCLGSSPKLVFIWKKYGRPMISCWSFICFHLVLSL